MNGSEVIPSVVIDESGHLKLLQTKNDVHSLRETLHERSIEAKDLLSQMIHNAVAPAPVERHDPDSVASCNIADTLHDDVDEIVYYKNSRPPRAI